MPVRQTAPIGAPCWIDLQTSDPVQARSFYTELFGWQALEASAEFGGYFMFTRDGAPVAGCMPADAQAPVSDIWGIYLSTPDAAKAVASASEHGGQVVVQPMPVADLGTMAFVTDPSGAGIGLWQPDTFQGFSVLAEAGAPGWFELLTRDYTTAVRFYRDVFGWTTQVAGDTPEFRYTMAVDPSGAPGQDQLAGVMDASGWLPAELPDHWSVYFTVDETRDAVARVTELGGRVLRDPEDTPYGRLATVTDPTGAAFKLVGPNDQMPARS